MSDFESVYTSKTVESAWNSLKSILLPAIDLIAPLVTRKIRGRQRPWLQNKTKREMIEHDRLLRKAIFPSKPRHSTGQAFKIDNNLTTNKKLILNGFGSFFQQLHTFFNSCIRTEENIFPPDRFCLKILKKGHPTC